MVIVNTISASVTALIRANETSNQHHSSLVEVNCMLTSFSLNPDNFVKKTKTEMRQRNCEVKKTRHHLKRSKTSNEIKQS